MSIGKFGSLKSFRAIKKWVRTDGIFRDLLGREGIISVGKESFLWRRNWNGNFLYGSGNKLYFRDSVGNVKLLIGREYFYIFYDVYYNNIYLNFINEKSRFFPRRSKWASSEEVVL